MEETGRLPGRMKLLTLGGTPKPLVTFGDPKSSIPSFKMIPVCSEQNPAPKLNSANKINSDWMKMFLERIIY